MIIDPALVKASWGTAADAQINIVPQSRFFNQWNTVTGVNTGTGRIDIADSERHRTIDSGSWFWIEGVREELDEPGEWFLDTTSGRLYYMPEPGVDPNTLTIVAPFLNRIVNAQGDVNAGTHVEHVHFDGLEFRHTTFTLGHIEARVHTDTAIMFENTNDSSVRNCHFENIGGYALWLHLDSRRNVFDRNTVRYSGGGGVLLTGARLSYMDDTKVYTPGRGRRQGRPDPQRDHPQHRRALREDPLLRRRGAPGLAALQHVDGAGQLHRPQPFQRPLAQRRLRLPQPGRQRGGIQPHPQRHADHHRRGLHPLRHHEPPQRAELHPQQLALRHLGLRAEARRQPDPQPRQRRLPRLGHQQHHREGQLDLQRRRRAR